MDIINFFVNLLSDPRGAIAGWIIALGPLWVYSPLFLIVFVETGLVFFPFLDVYKRQVWTTRCARRRSRSFRLAATRGSSARWIISIAA